MPKFKKYYDGISLNPINEIDKPYMEYISQHRYLPWSDLVNRIIICGQTIAEERYIRNKNLLFLKIGTVDLDEQDEIIEEKITDKLIWPE